MGIVVCLTMLLGLLMFWPARLPPILPAPMSNDKRSECRFCVAVLVLLIGIWNIFWYGLQHLHYFWGMAAVVSGVIMLLAAIILVAESRDRSDGIVEFVYQRLKPLRALLILALLASFLLYAVTLIQLNLGYPIIQ